MNMSDQEKGLPESGTSFESKPKAITNPERAGAAESVDRLQVGAVDIEAPATELLDKSHDSNSLSDSRQNTLKRRHSRFAAAGDSRVDPLKRVDISFENNKDNFYALKQGFKEIKEDFISKRAA